MSIASSAAIRIASHALNVRGMDVVYTPRGGQPVSIRAYLSSTPVRLAPASTLAAGAGIRGGGTPVMQRRTLYMLVRCEDVPEPRVGDTVSFEAAKLGVLLSPASDPAVSTPDGIATRPVSAEGRQCIEGVYWSLEVTP